MPAAVSSQLRATSPHSIYPQQTAKNKKQPSTPYSLDMANNTNKKQKNSPCERGHAKNKKRQSSGAQTNSKRPSPTSTTCDHTAKPPASDVPLEPRALLLQGSVWGGLYIITWPLRLHRHHERLGKSQIQRRVGEQESWGRCRRSCQTCRRHRRCLSPSRP